MFFKGDLATLSVYLAFCTDAVSRINRTSCVTVPSMVAVSPVATSPREASVFCTPSASCEAVVTIHERRCANLLRSSLRHDTGVFECRLAMRAVAWYPYRSDVKSACDFQVVYT